MRRANHIPLVLTAILMAVGTQFTTAQYSDIDLAKLPAHIKLKNAQTGVNTQEYVDAVSNADFDRYRYRDKIRILKFESGVEFQLLPLNGNSSAETETEYKATLKLLPTGKIVQLVPNQPGKDSPSNKLKPTGAVTEVPGEYERQRSNPHVSYSTAPAKMTPKSTESDRLKQLEEMRKKAEANGVSVDKYNKAIEVLRKKLEELKKRE
ncbi:MAG TPA: hypothetical protein EYN38_06240 [Flavobacteriales bacterium]|nr:hypothetical protein [Flavobacteriales bacterium]